MDLLLEHLDFKTPAVKYAHQEAVPSQAPRFSIPESHQGIRNLAIPDELFETELLQVQTSLVASDRPITKPEFLNDVFWLSPLIANPSNQDRTLFDINSVKLQQRLQPRNFQFFYSHKEDPYSLEFLYKSNQPSIAPYYDSTFPEYTLINSLPIAFWVIAKPFSKGYILAKKLAKVWNCEFVDVNIVLSKIFDFIPYKQASHIQQLLRLGLNIEGELLFQLVAFYLNTDFIRSRGYVLYGLPYPSETIEATTQIKWMLSFDYLPTMIIFYNYPKEEINTRCRDEFINNVYFYEDDLTDLLKSYPELITTLSEYMVDKAFIRGETEPHPTFYFENAFWNQNTTDTGLSLLFEITIQDVMSILLTKLNPENVIVLDERFSIYDNMKLIAAHLTVNGLLPNQKAKKLRTDYNVLIINEDIYIPSDLDMERYMAYLSVDNIRIGFNWHFSPWGIYCPYELKKGKLIAGRPELCASYYDKIYFFSSRRARSNFLLRPKDYLCHPYPIPICKIAIIGHHLSGKSIMSHLLASIFNATVISYKSLHDKFLKAKLRVKFDSNRHQERHQLIKKRQSKWCGANSPFITKLKRALFKLYNIIDDFLKKWNNGEFDCYLNHQNFQTCVFARIHRALDLASYLISRPYDIAIFLDNWKNTLSYFLPEELYDYAKANFPRTIPSGDVIYYEMIDKAEREIIRNNKTLLTDEIVGILAAAIERIEFHTQTKTKGQKMTGGWIIDGLPNDAKLISKLRDIGFGPDHIICLRDTNEDQAFALSVFLKHLMYKGRFFHMNALDPEVLSKLNSQNDAFMPIIPKLDYFKPRGTFSKIPQNDILAFSKCTCSLNPCYCDVYQRKVEEFLKRRSLKKYPPSFYFFRLPYFKTFEDILSLTLIQTQYYNLYLKCLSPLRKDAMGYLLYHTWIKNYYKYLQNYKNGIEQFFLKLKYQCKDIFIHDIDVANKGPETLLKEIYGSLQGIFHIPATRNVKEDMDYEYDQQKLGSLHEFEKDFGPKDNLCREVFYPKVRYLYNYGESFVFCPVALKDYNILWRGKEQYHAKLEHNDIFLSNKDNFERFLKDSRIYLPYRTIPILPPLRIFITGPPGCGKNEITKSLADHLSLDIINFEEVFNLVLTSGRAKYIRRNFTEWSPPFDFQVEEDIESWEYSFSNSNPTFKFESDPSIIIDEAERIDTLNIQKKYFKSERPFAKSQKQFDRLLSSYLSTGRGVPNKLLKLVFDSFWNNHQKGFILAGFPYHTRDLEFMKKMFYIPDLIIYLKVDEDETMTRKLFTEYEYQSDYFYKKLNKKDKYEKEAFFNWNKKRSRYFWDLAFKYGVSIENELEEENFDQIPWARIRSGAEHLPKIQKLIEKRYPIPQFKEIYIETPDEMKKRIQDYFRFLLGCHKQCLTKLKKWTLTELVPCYLCHSKTGCLPEITKELLQFIEQKKFTRNEDFMSFSVINLPDAIDLLTEGYFTLSPNGFYCPVQTNIAYNPLFMFTYGHRNEELCCVVNRNKIYYIRGMSRFFTFTHDTQRILKEDYSQQYYSQFRLAILGHVKSGKTEMARYLEERYSVKTVTLGSAIRNLLENFQNTSLGEYIMNRLSKGHTLTSYLEAACVYLSLQDPNCIMQGFVFDGFPNKESQLIPLIELNLLPLSFCIINSTFENVTYNYLMENRIYRDDFPKYPKSFIDESFNRQIPIIDSFCKYLGLNSFNYFCVSMNESINNNFLAISQHIFSLMYRWILFNKNKDQLGTVVNVGVNHLPVRKFKQNQTPFRKMCPVCFKNYHVSCPQNREDFIRGVVKYQANFFWICRLHEHHFYYDPETYKEVDISKVPKMVPQFIGATDWLVQSPFIFAEGICITCLLRSFEMDKIVPGIPFFSIDCSGFTFMFCSKLCLLNFIQNPDYFLRSGIRMLDIDQIAEFDYFFRATAEGYINIHKVYHLLSLALFLLNKYRPKIHPFSSKRTAAMFVAYFLKAHNDYKDPALAAKWQAIFKNYLFRVRRYMIGLNKQKHLKGLENAVINLGQSFLDKVIQEEEEEEEVVPSMHEILPPRPIHRFRCSSDSEITDFSSLDLSEPQNLEIEFEDDFPFL